MRYYLSPKTEEEAASWIERNTRRYREDGFGLWVIQTPEGEFLGDCGLSWQELGGHRDLEVGYHFLPEHHGRGLATEAARACRDFAWRRGIQRLTVNTHPLNLPSRRVAEKLGMQVEWELDAAGMPVVVYALERERKQEGGHDESG